MATSWYKKAFSKVFDRKSSGYKEVATEESSGNDDFNKDEESIPNKQRNSIEEDDGKGRISNLEAFWNIFSINQGVINLSMPFVIFKGTYISAAFTVLIAVVSNYTGKNVVRCLYDVDEETGIEVRVRNTFEDIGEAFGGKFWKWLVYISMLVEMLSYCTLLLILCGTILHNSFPHFAFSKSTWSMFAFIFVIPNAFMIQPKQIAMISLIDIVIGQIVVVVVTVYCFTRFDGWEMEQTPHLDISQIFVCIGTVVLSYSSQPYMPAIESGMANRGCFNTVMDIGFFSTAIIKLLFGLIGYLAFQTKTAEVITNNLPRGAFKITVNLLVMMVALCSFTFPAYMIFCMIDKIQMPSKWLSKKIEQRRFLKSMNELSDKTLLFECDERGNIHDDKINVGDDEEKRVEDYGTQYCTIKKAIVRIVIILSVLTVAVLVPHFVLFMSFVGNFTGMCVAFIFPCLFHMNLRKLSKFEYFIHVVIIVFGCVFSGTGMYSSTKSLVYDYDQLN